MIMYDGTSESGSLKVVFPTKVCLAHLDRLIVRVRKLAPISTRYQTFLLFCKLRTTRSNVMVSVGTSGKPVSENRVRLWSWLSWEMLFLPTRSNYVTTIGAQKCAKRFQSWNNNKYHFNWTPLQPETVSQPIKLVLLSGLLSKITLSIYLRM